MKPPIFVYEPNDLDVFESVRLAERYLEPPDVLDGAYSAYDSEGRLLKLGVSDDGMRVVIHPGEPVPEHAQELRAAIIVLLSAVGVSRQWLDSASLPDLVHKALEYKTE